MSPSPKGHDVRAAAERATPAMLRFLQAMIAIPSESAEEAAVVARVADEMRRCDFDEVKIDPFGNVLGRVGTGPVVIALDGHLDTVGVGDRSTWTRDPHGGTVEGGVVYGRGASDQEAGIAAAVHGARIAKELGLLEGVQLWVTGTVMEEDCDGLCWQYILRERVLSPEVVVITEPTNLGVYRGHRGRMEIEVRTQGRSAHGSAPERGDNAVLAPGIEAGVFQDAEGVDLSVENGVVRLGARLRAVMDEDRRARRMKSVAPPFCPRHRDARTYRH